MSDTAKDWRMVADLLAANADRFLDVDLTEVIMLCRAEVDRLGREDAEKPAPEEWPHLNSVPVVKIVANLKGAQADHHYMLGWRWRLTGGVVSDADRATIWTEVSA